MRARVYSTFLFVVLSQFVALGPALAEEGEQEKQRPAAEEEVVITGSRIRRKDLTSPAPVTVIDREQIAASGKISIGEFLQTLPEQGNAINTQVNNGGNGSTRVSLRSLGPERTLVLVNGRRLMPGGTGADGSVDLNSIPSAAVERVEVLKDGASPIYGSDAVAGVVNIILRRDYRTTEVSAYTGTSTRGDGTTYDFSVITGVGGDRGNITFSVEYYNQQPVWAGARNWSRIPRAFDATGQTNPFGTVGEFTVGSNAIPQGRIILPASAVGAALPNPENDAKIAFYNQLVTTYPNARSFVHCDPVTDKTCTSLAWRPYVQDVITEFGGDAYNYLPQNYLVTPQQRISLYTAGEIRLDPVGRGFFEATYVNRQSEQELAPEPLIVGPAGIPVTISKASIYNPFGVDITDFRRRLNEFDNRVYDQEIDNFHIVAGLDGLLPTIFGPLHGWFWEVSFNYGRTAGQQVIKGSLLVPSVQDAVGPSFVDPVTKKPTCGTQAAPIAKCVPLDVFDGPGTITPDQTTNLTFIGPTRGLNQLAGLQINTSGELFSLFGARPLGLAVGYEFRRLKGTFVPDPISASGQSTGDVIPVTGGSYSVNEGYAELSVPVVSRLPFVEALEVAAAMRVFNYSTSGTDWTYKVGGRWQLVPDITLRSTYSTAFRAPSISNLYTGQIESFFEGVQDPCAGPLDPASARAKSCGLAANNGAGPGAILRYGGNPDLKPERATVFTAGVVLEPRFVPNFTVTADYYNIVIDQAIVAGLFPNDILNACYPDQPGVAPKYCDLVQRDPTTQSISRIVNLYANVARLSTDGIDLAVRYALPTTIGRFAAAFDGTWLHKIDQTNPDGTITHGRGTFDLSAAEYGGANPAFKFNAGIGWALDRLGAAMNMRFVGAIHECADQGFFVTLNGRCSADATYRRLVPNYASFDVQLRYELRTGAGKTIFTVGANNVFDRTPPVIYSGFTAATDPATYDFMGRFVYGRIAHSF